MRDRGRSRSRVRDRVRSRQRDRIRGEARVYEVFGFCTSERPAAVPQPANVNERGRAPVNDPVARPAEFPVTEFLNESWLRGRGLRAPAPQARGSKSLPGAAHQLQLERNLVEVL